MKENLFPRRKPPIVEGLSEQEIEQVISFTRPAFGTSNWGTRAGAQHKPYYFNLDQAMGSFDTEESGLFFDSFAKHIRSVIGHPGFLEVLGGQEPVLGYVCTIGAPAGIVQLRSALSQRLNLASVLIFPVMPLLRSRVVCHGENSNFPDSVKWLRGRHVLLLTDATTSGDSLARAKGVLSAFGALIFAAVAVYDREEGAADSLDRVDVPLFPVYRAGRFIATRVHVPADENLVQKIQECTRKEQIVVRDLSAVVANAS